jgi:riboflavin biosynthesis pyrimidine reductase
VATIATLVLGQDGSSTLSGTSLALSTDADRARFLTRRRNADCILTGGKSARIEGYASTPVPLVILSRREEVIRPENPLAHQWNCSITDAIAEIHSQFGEEIMIEGGVNFLRSALSAGVVDQIELSITPIRGGENKVKWQSLAEGFTEVKRDQIIDTEFISLKRN